MGEHKGHLFKAAHLSLLRHSTPPPYPGMVEDGGHGDAAHGGKACEELAGIDPGAREVGAADSAKEEGRHGHQHVHKGWEDRENQIKDTTGSYHTHAHTTPTSAAEPTTYADLPTCKHGPPVVPENATLHGQTKVARVPSSQHSQ